MTYVAAIESVDVTTATEQLETRIEEIEVKLTLLESANEQMSQVIIEQQASIDKLTQRLEMAQRQMSELGEQISQDNTPPPHY